MLSFSVLLWVGGEIHRVMPPIPSAVVTDGRQDVYTRADIRKAGRCGNRSAASSSARSGVMAATSRRTGRADWLHREAVAWLDIDAGANVAALRGACRKTRRPRFAARLRPRIRENTYDARPARSPSRTIAPRRSRKSPRITTALFGNDPALHELRKAYAMKNDTVLDAEHAQALTAFIWWSAWSAVTERPGKDITYTNNWPHDPLVGNDAARAPAHVDGVQRVVPDRRHRAARLAPCATQRRDARRRCPRAIRSR